MTIAFRYQNLYTASLLITRPRTYIIIISRYRCTGIDGRRGTVQLGADHAHDARALGLRVHGGQRGDLRHLPAEPGHRAAHVHEP